MVISFIPTISLLPWDCVRVLQLTDCLICPFVNICAFVNGVGIAVVSVMVVTTTFLTLIMILVWQVNLWIAIAFSVFFGSIELVYFSSCLYKVPEGGYTPLIIGSVALFIMCIWHYARKRSYDFEVRNKISLDWVLALGPNLGGLRVPGVGLIYTELAQVCLTYMTQICNSLVHY